MLPVVMLPESSGQITVTSSKLGPDTVNVIQNIDVLRDTEPCDVDPDEDDFARNEDEPDPEAEDVESDDELCDEFDNKDGSNMEA